MTRSKQYESRTLIECRSTYVMRAEVLEQLARQKLARPLQGDYRTERANVMKNPATRVAGGVATVPVEGNTNSSAHASHRLAANTPIHFLARVSRSDTAKQENEQKNPAIDAGLPVNPNRTSVKTLALPTGWSQELVIEKHRHHAGLLYPYLICPITKQRYKKLLMVLCTPEEAADAAAAHLWLRTHYDHAPPLRKTQLHPTAVKLLNRYGVLFPPRLLMSRGAMPMTYGEVK